jgi:hypothetical protein
MDSDNKNQNENVNDIFDELKDIKKKHPNKCICSYININSFRNKFGFIKDLLISNTQGRIQDFKLGGAHLKKLRRAEVGAKIFGVFRVKNHDFTPKHPIFPILGGGCTFTIV